MPFAVSSWPCVVVVHLTDSLLAELVLSILVKRADAGGRIASLLVYTPFVRVGLSPTHTMVPPFARQPKH
jgi:hypothetical protein